MPGDEQMLYYLFLEMEPLTNWSRVSTDLRNEW